MKGKKIIAFLTVVLLIVTAVVTLVACTDGDSVNGTYYLFENEKLHKDSFITLDGSTWKDDNGDSGSYSVNGKSITLFVEFMGEKEEFATGTVSDGVLTLKIMGASIVYCKEGKEPSSGGGDDNPPVTEKYTVTYDANGGTFTSGSSTLNQSDIASQTLLTAPSSPTRNGYNFGGWSKTKNKSDMWKFDTDKVTSNITLYAVWQQESAVILSMEGASIDGRSIFMLVNSDTVRVPLANKVVCSEDSIWRLYYDELGQMEIPTKIAASQNGALYNGENVFYIVVTSSNGSQVNVYELTIHRSYEVSITYYDGGSVLHSTSIYTGNTLKETDLYSYDKIGYTFNSWKTSAGQKYVSGEVWSSLSLYADTTANDYTVTLNTNGGDELTNKTKTVTYDSGYTLPVPTKKGHAFDGWYLGGTKLTDEKGKSISPWRYASDKEITAKWVVKQYKVALESNYPTAIEMKGAGVYNFGNNIKISANEYKWFKFIGWYNGSTLLTDKAEYTFTLDDKDVKYTAKFEPVAEMANFNFTATPTSCSITSVKDKTLKSITVPSYVTGYSDGAFYGCTALESLSFPISSNGFKYLFKDNNGKIEVPNSLTTVAITGGKYISSYAFNGCGSITSVTIGNSVTSIGDNAFSGCTGLTSITIPKSVTSISYDAFYKCSSLTSVTIPDSVTSIGSSVFAGCSGLTSITIPDRVKSIGNNAFNGCNRLTSVTIGSGVTSIGEYAFYNCSSLVRITLPFVGAKLGGTENTYFGYIFGTSKYTDDYSKYVPKSLKEVVITGGKSIDSYAFYNCSSITSVTTGNNVTSIGEYAFKGCSNLSNVTIGNSVTSIGNYAFQYCSGLTSVTIGNSVRSISDSAFSGCGYIVEVYNLSNLDIIKGSSNYGGVAYNALDVYTALTETSKISEKDNMILHTDGDIITLVKYNGSEANFVIPSYMTSIGKSAFQYCSGLTSITIPDSVTSIDSFAFNGCSSLVSITLPFVGAKLGGTENTYFGYIFGASEYSKNADYVPKSLKEVIITGGESIASYAFYKCSGLTSITIPDSVTSIGNYAFYGCSGLTNVTIPDSVTSIGIYAFYVCSGLTNVTIPDSVTSIGDYAFRNCSSLTSVTIPDSVTSIGYWAFSGCSNITEMNYKGTIAQWCAINGLSNIPKNDSILYVGGDKLAGDLVIPDGVTSIGESAFSECSGLISVTIPDSVTSIGNSAFKNCAGLTSVTIGSGVTSIGESAFSECSGLISVTIPDSVTSIGNSAFSGCAGLTSVTIGSGVTSIGNSAFENCVGLTNVTIPDSVTSVGNSAFSGCTGLTNVIIGNGVTSIGSSAFKGCSGLTSISLPFVGAELGGTENTHLGYIFGASRYSYNSNYVPKSLKEVIITGGESIAERAFYECSSLTSVTLPDSVTNIGGDAFRNCSGLISVIIGNSVTSIGYEAFAYCSGLTSVTIPDSVTSIGNYAFYNCSSLTRVTIPNSVTSIGNSAFSGCSGLKSVIIPNSVTSIGGSAFSGCSGLTSITLPFVGAKLGGTENTHFGYIFGASRYNDNADYVPKSLKEVINIGGEAIGNYAFYNCTGLTSVTIPNSVISIGDRAFSGCSNLTSVTIPDSVTSIGSSAFYGCSSLTSVTIGISVTSIGEETFYKCSNLTNITLPFIGAELGGTNNTHFGYIFGASNYSENAKYLPKSLNEVIITGGESIGEYAFYDCRSLTSVTIPDSITSIGSSAFSYYSNISEVKYNGTIEQWCAISGLDNLMGLSSNKKLYIGGNEITGDLVIPDGVTTIGKYAFYGCSNLTSVTIVNGVTTIGKYAFYGCSNLTSVTIVNGVTSIDYGVFKNCTSLASVTIPDSVISIGEEAFEDCSSLTSVTIGNGVTSIGLIAFYGCSNISEVKFNGTIGQWCSISGLDNLMRYSSNKKLYIGGNELTELVIPDSVTSIGKGAFSGCSSLASITLPFVGAELGGTNNTHFGYIFGASNYSENAKYVPNSLKEVIITGGESIGDHAFYECRSLTSVTIPDSITSIGSSAFYNCRNISEVKYNGTIEQWLNISGLDNLMAYSSNKKLYIGGSELTELVIPDSITSISGYAFRGCSGLTSVTIVNGVTSIDSYAFYECSGLTSVTIPNSVTSIGSSAFSGCYTLAEIYNLSSLNITKGSTEYGYLAYYALDVYNSLSEPSKLIEKDGMILHTDGDNVALVKYIGSETNIVIPNYIVNIGSGAFSGCSGLTSIIIPDSVTSIGSFAFSGCSGLTSIIIPDSVTSIGLFAFSACRGLVSVMIGNSVKSIGNSAFKNCTSLASVTIPDSVRSIGEEAFRGCSSLTSVIFVNTSGWFMSESSNATSGTDISVTDPSQNAKYLTDTYYNYYWKRG